MLHQQNCFVMAGKKGASASKSKDSTKSKESASETSKTKLKPATAINARHILCEKHSKKEEALTKLREGAKFDEVAREFSEDKARQVGTLRVYKSNREEGRKEKQLVYGRLS